MKFEELGLAEPILRAVRGEEYEIATPIQIQAIPPVLKGRDLMGCAQTGTGKTAAFALPTLHLLAQRLAETPAGEDFSQSPRQQVGHKQDPRGPQARGQQNRGAFGRPVGPARRIRALILSPTRELAAQIGESFRAYGQFTGLRHSVVFGGVSQVPQVRDLRFGIDILVATPGRLIDLMQQGYIDLSHVEILILDEADQMLDMGFIVPLRKIVAQVPRRRQTLMFSATMPPEIRKLAAEWLRDPVSIQVAPVATPAELVQQNVFFIEPKQKPYLLANYLKSTPHSRTLVFSRTKHGADKIAKHLNRDGIRAEAIHGNKSQGARVRVLAQFKSERPPVLVATDIAARGLDIDAISHVINYDIPEVAETYVHRIGRTGRAGATGIAVAFCSREERSMLRDIERLMRMTIPSLRLPPIDGSAAQAEPAMESESAPESRESDRPRFRGQRSGQRPGRHHSGEQRRRENHRPARSHVNHTSNGNNNIANAVGNGEPQAAVEPTESARPVIGRRPFPNGQRRENRAMGQAPGKRRRFRSSKRA